MVIVYDPGGASALRMAGPGTVRLLAMTWTVHESGTGTGTRDGAVQCTCVHARLLNTFTLVILPHA